MKGAMDRTLFFRFSKKKEDNGKNPILIKGLRKRKLRLMKTLMEEEKERLCFTSFNNF